MSLREDPRRIAFPDPKGPVEQLHATVSCNDVDQA